MATLDKPTYDVPPQIELAKRKTAEARYAIAASSALIVFISGGAGSGIFYVTAIIFAAIALVSSTVYYWSSFEIEKRYRLINIRDAVGFPVDGDEMIMEKRHRRSIWFHLDLSDWAQRISFVAFALSAVSYGVTGALFGSLGAI